MEREEAYLKEEDIKRIGLMLKLSSAKEIAEDINEFLIDKIYDDLESRTCENCKHQEGIGCEVYPAAWNWFSLNESEFSCNQWKRK